MKRVGSVRRFRGRGSVGWVGLVSVSGLLGCDIPTSAPILEPRFVVPGASARVGVDALLPSGIGFGADVFAVQVNNSVTTWTLGEVCGEACALADGQSVPKPEFAVTLTSELPLPAGVQSAVVRSGVLTLRVANSLGFDPLRPSATAAGSAEIEVRSGQRVVAKRTYTGTLPTAAMTDIELPLTQGEIAGTLLVTVTLNSPEGPAVWLDPEAYLVIGPATSVELTSALIAVVNQPIEAAFTSLDLSGVDEAARERVREGALLLRFDNPFDVSARMELALSPAAGRSIKKALSVIPPGESMQRVELTGAEMRSLLGQVVGISAAGMVNQASEAGVVVRPTDAIDIRADIDLTISTAAN